MDERDSRWHLAHASFSIASPNKINKYGKSIFVHTLRQKKKIPKDVNPERLWRSVRGITLFATGTLFGLYVVSWFVSLLPGPELSGRVQGLRALRGNASGCTFYQFSVGPSHEPTDFISLKIQFPTRITNFKVGYPMETHSEQAGRSTMQAWELGRSDKGECNVVQSAIDNTIDVQSASAGNMIMVHASKASPNTMIVGIVATDPDSSSISPKPVHVLAEGSYEYQKLGQNVRKPLAITDSGISDVK